MQLIDVIAKTIQITRERGWLSGNAAEAQGRQGQESWRAVAPGLEASPTIRPDDRIQAEDVILWARNLDPDSDPDSDFLGPLQEAMSEDEVDVYALPRVCSAVDAYRRAQEDLMAAQSEHVGGVGDRWEGVVTLLSQRELTTNYGPRWLIKLATPGDNVLTYWGNTQLTMKVGSHSSASAIIKKHGKFRGGQETTVDGLQLGDE